MLQYETPLPWCNGDFNGLAVFDLLSVHDLLRLRVVLTFYRLSIVSGARGRAAARRESVFLVFHATTRGRRYFKLVWINKTMPSFHGLDRWRSRQRGGKKLDEPGKKHAEKPSKGCVPRSVEKKRHPPLRHQSIISGGRYCQIELVTDRMVQ